MRGFAKSMLSYTWSTSLFGLQQMASLLTPQGWRQTDQAAESFESVTKATAEEMHNVVRSTFKAGDDFQRRSLDVTFDVFTLGMFDRSKGQSAPAASSSTGTGTGTGTVSHFGEQAAGAFTAGLQAAGQTAGIIAQAIGGAVPGQSCGGAQSPPTGWGPVPPPPGSGG
jgi:hypothetical protein